MRPLRILIGCEESGVVREAFNALGHDAWSCDLLPSRIPGRHFQTDVLQIIRAYPWDMLIAFPDCTYVAGSGMHWTARGLRDPELTVQGIKFAEALWDSGIPKITIENPVGVFSTRSKLGRPTQTIQPYNFGEDASKRTCLWLKGLPPLKPTNYIEPRMACPCGECYSYQFANLKGCPHCGAEPGLAKPRWANQTDSGQNKLTPNKDRARDRSATYPGIAKAMAIQWSEIL